MNQNKKHQLILAAYLDIFNYQDDSDPKHLEKASDILRGIVEDYVAEKKATGCYNPVWRVTYEQ